MTRFVIHNHLLPARRVGDAASEEEALRKEVLRLRKELANVDSNKPGALKKYDAALANLEKAEAALKALQSKQRDFRGVVGRDQEERNRRESYDRTGIRRV
jgi:hypothetical protein